MKPAVPESLKTEHNNLKDNIKDVIASGGETAQEAKKFASFMEQHFLKEEESILPNLGLLLTLAEGKWIVTSSDIFLMGDQLKKEVSELQEEHKQIIKMLEDLKIKAENENNIGWKKIVEDLMLHVQIEEEILYPATIVVGKYLDELN